MKTKFYLNLKSWLLMMLMLIGAGGNLWADEVVAYTLDGTATGGTNGYTDASNITQNGLNWSITGNTTMSPWRIGGKNLTKVDRTLYSKTAMSDAISKIEVEVGAASSITVNSFKLIVASDANFRNKLDEVIAKFSANSTITFNPSSGTEWSSNDYYQFVFNVTVGSSNKYVEFKKATFYKNVSADDTPSDPDVSFASNSLSLEVGETATNAINKPSGLNVTYSSGDQSVATVDVNGVVTGVGVGETTITASWTAVANTFNAGSKSYAVNVTPATPSTTYVKVTNANQLVAGNEYILVASQNSMAMGGQNLNYRNEVAVTIAENQIRIKSEDVAVLTLGGEPDAWTFKDADGNYLALTSDKNEIHTSDAATNNNSKWTIDRDFRVYNKYYTGRCIDHNNSGSRFACYKETYKNAYLYVKEGSAIDDKENASVSIDATSLTVGGETAQITAAPEGLVMSYESSAPAIASVSNGVVTGLAHGSATITVSWEEQTVGGKTYNAGSREFEISVVDPNRPGTQTNPYTVAQARAAIDAGTDVTGVYATGIVSEIVTAYSSLYGNITYNISVDGSTTADQLQAYRGKSFNGEKFTSENDIQIGDEVVIYGNLTKYGETYEFGADNQLVSITHPKHNVTWMVNGEEKGTSEIERGATLTYETPADIEGKTFVGWVAAEIDGETDEAPNFVTVMPNNDVTLYAVFAEGEETESDATYTLDYSTESNLSSSTQWGSYGKQFTYTATDGGVWVVKAYKNQGMQINTGKNASIKIPECAGYITSIEITGNAAKAVGLSASDYSGSDTITYIAEGTNATVQTLDLTGKNVTTGYIVPKSGNISITKITVNYTKKEASFTNYCTTVVKPIELAQPIIFHDDGDYEGELTVAIAGEGVKYTLNDGAEQTYTQPFTISETTTVKAWAEQDGVKSDVVEKTFTIVEAQKGPSVADGYYTIKTNEGKYVNVAGRKTVTLVDDTEGKAGTIIRVKATDGKVETLRSQGVDVPSYAKKAMNYVPEIVRLAVDKLHAEGAGELLGTTGYEKIMDKFNEAFDYNLYLEQDGEAYRIYGRTPSMKHVVDFYAENKANVDAKLPELEEFINKAIDKVLEKTGGRGASILVDFDLHNVWQNMGSTLTEPTDEASTMKFYEEVLTSEANVWNFAYQTAMIYWGNLKDHPKFQENLDKLGDYSKYINKVENIRPDFKYYIVPSASGVDFISEGNYQITDASTAWTMEAASEFNAKFEVEQSHTVYSTQGGVQAEYKEYYTTLYTDFAYTLPEGVKAYKVTEITEKHGVAKREEMTGVIPAQTPVLLVSSNEGAQALTLTTEAGTAVTGNLLVGADALINEYQIKTPQVESLFNLAKDVLGDNAYENYLKKYEHLMMKNAGTVGNKYFFGLTEDDINQCTTLNDNGEEDCVIRSLSDGDEKVGFYGNWEAAANKGFLVTSDFNPVKLSLVGDVNRDGNITIADVTALVNIILGKVTYPEDNDKYDFEAANVNGDKSISIADVTALVNIILGK